MDSGCKAFSSGGLDQELIPVLAVDPVRRLAPVGPVAQDVAPSGSMSAGQSFTLGQLRRNRSPAAQAATQWRPGCRLVGAALHRLDAIWI